MATVRRRRFVVAYLLIATERINKVKAALGGAAVVVAIGILGSEDVFYSRETGIDWDVIFLLLGMMVIVGVLRQTGVFEYTAIWAAKRAKGSPLRVMILLALITASHRRFLDNVTTVLLIAPVTLLVCERLDINPVPFLIAEVFASNIGGAATLIGDPPNIIIASRAGLSFNDFLVNMAPMVVIALVVFLAIAAVAVPRIVRRRSGPGGRSDGAQRARSDPRRAAADQVRGGVGRGLRRRSSGTRCSTSSRRWWRCSAPGSWSLISGVEPPTTWAASNGRRCCSSPGCSSWSARWSRPA